MCKVEEEEHGGNETVAGEGTRGEDKDYVLREVNKAKKSKNRRRNRVRIETIYTKRRGEQGKRNSEGRDED